ncbi:YbgA family protein [Shewanella algae]
MYKFEPQRIQLGISACLLGQQVRFDGGHKNSVYCQQELRQHFDFVPVCPEMAIGMGAPRKSIRQVRRGDEFRIQSRDASLDVTESLQSFSEQKVAELGFLSGYLLCAKSPTCGMERVTVYKEGGDQGNRSGIGVFAKALMQRWPQLPVEEEGRLNDLVIRENFFTRVYAFHDWQCLLHSGLSLHKLTQFHARYKYLLLAHSPAQYRQLGPLLAEGGEDLQETARRYFEGFMEALKNKASRRNHTSALQHIQGYFKQKLTKAQKAELSQAIDEYRQGLQPLLVPLTLIKHYLREHPQPYIAAQVYLNPHPQELKLRYAY